MIEISNENMNQRLSNKKMTEEKSLILILKMEKANIYVSVFVCVCVT